MKWNPKKTVPVINSALNDEKSNRGETFQFLKLFIGHYKKNKKGKNIEIFIYIFSVKRRGGEHGNFHEFIIG